MRDKINRIAKGLFEYETNELLVSSSKLEFEVETASKYKGSFILTNKMNCKMKGVIFTKDRNMKILTENFTEKEIEIFFEYSPFDTMQPGELAVGEIVIVSSLGQVVLPYEAKLVLPSLTTSLGKVRDFYQFTNLAKEDPASAIQCFKSPEFKRVFLYKEEEQSKLYDTLIQSMSTSQALEEFLIAIHKKVRIKLTPSTTRFCYNNVTEDVKEKLMITKDQWGYTEYKITTDCGFVHLDHKMLWGDNFIGNTYTLGFVVAYDSLQRGENVGHIYLTSMQQTIEIEVVAYCNNKGTARDIMLSKKKEYEALLTNKYLEFRLGVITKEEYEERLEAILYNLNAIEPSIRYSLWQAHLYMVAGKKEALDKSMLNFRSQEKELLEESVYDYIGYLYLKAMYSKKNEDIQFAIDTINEYYGKEYNHWILLWFLLYLDHQYEENQKVALEHIISRMKDGVNTPILYYEACAIYNRDSSLLKELGKYELRIMNWGIKNQCISKSLAEQYAFLSSRMKGYQPYLFQNLGKLYEATEMQEVLAAICRMLINGHKVENKYFKWYQLGIRKQLKITELYEYYMYAIPEDEPVEIEHNILLYFIYNNNLPERKKAYLYAYIIRNKEKLSSIYGSYQKQIEGFVRRNLLRHNISRELSVVYADVLTQEYIDEELAKALPYIMFKVEITCNNPKIKGILVTHKELKEEEYVSLVDGRAIVNCYTDSSKLFLVDVERNRYVTTIEYTMNTLLEYSLYAKRCYEWNKNNPYLLLYMANNVYPIESKEGESYSIQNRLMLCNEVSDEYKKDAYLDMVQYYNTQGMNENLEEYLRGLDLGQVEPSKRYRIIECYIARELYEQAIKGISLFGWEQVDEHRLLKLCSYMIEQGVSEQQYHYFMPMCLSLFQRGKANEYIVSYLTACCETDLETLYAIWKEAKSKEIRTVELEERILAQLLFTGTEFSHSLEVFQSYHGTGDNRMLIRAYLNQYAFYYLNQNRECKKEVIDYMVKESYYEKNDVTMMAVLKYYSKKIELTKEEIEFVDYNLHEFINQGMIMPFYKKFQRYVQLPEGICNKHYVEYITNPKTIVSIGYQLEGQSEQKERMHHLMVGIHVIGFVMFYNEVIEYSIYEEDRKVETEIKHTTYQLREEESESDSKYGRINRMLIARQYEEEQVLIEGMKRYVEEEAIINSLFHPL